MPPVKNYGWGGGMNVSPRKTFGWGGGTTAPSVPTPPQLQPQATSTPTVPAPEGDEFQKAGFNRIDEYMKLLQSIQGAKYDPTSDRARAYSTGNRLLSRATRNVAQTYGGLEGKPRMDAMIAASDPALDYMAQANAAIDQRVYEDLFKRLGLQSNVLGQFDQSNLGWNDRERQDRQFGTLSAAQRANLESQEPGFGDYLIAGLDVVSKFVKPFSFG